MFMYSWLLVILIEVLNSKTLINKKKQQQQQQQPAMHPATSPWLDDAAALNMPTTNLYSQLTRSLHLQTSSLLHRSSSSVWLHWVSSCVVVVVVVARGLRRTWHCCCWTEKFSSTNLESGTDTWTCSQSVSQWCFIPAVFDCTGSTFPVILEQSQEGDWVWFV